MEKLKISLGAKKSWVNMLLQRHLARGLQIPLDFEYFKQPVSPYYLHEDLIVTIELNKPEKVMLCSNDAADNLHNLRYSAGT